tara:strand:+ start:164 stop:427 length:264 start_codon:yes stop_codon:yes gene_type:complete
VVVEQGETQTYTIIVEIQELLQQLPVALLRLLVVVVDQRKLLVNQVDRVEVKEEVMLEQVLELLDKEILVEIKLLVQVVVVVAAQVL